MKKYIQEYNKNSENGKYLGYDGEILPFLYFNPLDEKIGMSDPSDLSNNEPLFATDELIEEGDEELRIIKLTPNTETDPKTEFPIERESRHHTQRITLFIRDPLMEYKLLEDYHNSLSKEDQALHKEAFELKSKQIGNVLLIHRVLETLTTRYRLPFNQAFTSTDYLFCEENIAESQNKNNPFVLIDRVIKIDKHTIRMIQFEVSDTTLSDRQTQRAIEDYRDYIKITFIPEKEPFYFPLNEEAFTEYLYDTTKGLHY